MKKETIGRENVLYHNTCNCYHIIVYPEDFQENPFNTVDRTVTHNLNLKHRELPSCQAFNRSAFMMKTVLLFRIAKIQLYVRIDF